ncbi:MAG: phosphoribosyltransferase [Nitriliruptoraceae bacterium]
MMAPAHRRCYRCAGSRQAGHACWSTTAPIDSTTTVFLDSGPLRRSLATATRYAAADSWRALAAMLARQYLLREGSETFVYAVPLARRAQRTQACDQRKLLATTFAALLTLPVGPTLPYRLRRHQTTGRTGAKRLSGCHVVLVTDVIHTGQSVWAAAQLFRDEASKSIDVVAITRRGEEPLGPLIG